MDNNSPISSLADPLSPSSPSPSDTSSKSATPKKSEATESDSTTSNVARSNVSKPPNGSPINHPLLGLRRQSRTSDPASSQRLNAPRHAVEPRSEPAQKMHPTTPFMLPDAALRPVRATDPETESNRLSFSSLYSLGSAIVQGARGFAGSGPSSVTGSESENIRKLP
jgi:inositol-hexakisphosphate/diphosphoinositol-pentakisphosphate 1-kinase